MPAFCRHHPRAAHDTLAPCGVRGAQRQQARSGGASEVSDRAPGPGASGAVFQEPFIFAHIKAHGNPSIARSEEPARPNARHSMGGAQVAPRTFLGRTRAVVDVVGLLSFGRETTGPLASRLSAGRTTNAPPPVLQSVCSDAHCVKTPFASSHSIGSSSRASPAHGPWTQRPSVGKNFAPCLVHSRYWPSRQRIGPGSYLARASMWAIILEGGDASISILHHETSRRRTRD